MEERSTITLELPDSKAIITLYSFLRNGDFRLLQRRLADKITIDPANPTGTKVPASLAFDEQDFTLETLTKEVHTKDGIKVEDIKNFFYNMTRRDGDVLYAKLNELTQGSTLSDEAKKK